MLHTRLIVIFQQGRPSSLMPQAFHFDRDNVTNYHRFIITASQVTHAVVIVFECSYSVSLYSTILPASWFSGRNTCLHRLYKSLYFFVFTRRLGFSFFSRQAPS